MKTRFVPYTRNSIGLLALLLAGVAAVFTSSATQAHAASATTTTLAVTAGGSTVTSVKAGTVVTLSATVKAGSAAVTVGSVNFCVAMAAHCDDVHIVGKAQLTSAGTATYKFRPGVGSHSYKAAFVGTETNKASSSATAGLAVVTPSGHLPSSTVIAKAGSAGSYTLTATVGGSGTERPTGTISFIDTTNGNAVLGTATLGAGAGGLSFLNSSNPVTGTGNYQAVGTWSIATADFNGDGKPDLVVTNRNGNTAVVLLGNGDGTFAAMPSIATGFEPNSVVVGDFNGDGIPDLAIANQGAPGSNGSVTVLLGNGDGTFTPGANPQTGVGPVSIVVGDFNGDGIPDLAVDNSASDAITVLLGDGKGNFTAKAKSPQTNGLSIALGDFNRDGITDLAVLNASTVSGCCTTNPGTLTVWLGIGDGTFKQVLAIPEVGIGPSSITVSDFNGDGIPDLAVANYDFGRNNTPGSVTVLIGNGDGTFRPAPMSPQTGPMPQGIASSDFDGDGIPDLAVVNAFDNTVTILLGNGDGTFKASAASPATGGFPMSIVVADFNGDGIPDLSTANYTGNTVTVLLTEPQAATSTSVVITLTAGSGRRQVAASYSGDSSNDPSESATTTLTAAVGTPTVALTAPKSPVYYGSSATFTAKVSGGGLTPTGSVIFFNGKTPLGSAALNANGGTTFTVTTLAVGSHSITASYSGNTNYLTATSAAATVTVIPLKHVPTAKLTASAGTATYGGFVDFKLTVAGSGGTPTGPVTFYDGATQFDKTNLNSSGIAAYGTRALTAGAHSITASYAGDSHYAAATSNAVSVMVSKATPAVKLKASARSAMIQTPVTFTATVTGTTSKAPVGTADFFDGSKKLGSAAVNASGVASFKTSKLTAGTHSITAEYTGHVNYTAKTSAAVTVTITAP